MRYQKTSLDAYLEIQPNLGEMQNIVFNIIKLYPFSSNRDLSDIMEKPINSITPRVKELRDKGLVLHGGYKDDEVSGKRVMTWITVC